MSVYAVTVAQCSTAVQLRRVPGGSEYRRAWHGGVLPQPQLQVPGQGRGSAVLRVHSGASDGVAVVVVVVFCNGVLYL